MEGLAVLSGMTTSPEHVIAVTSQLGIFKWTGRTLTLTLQIAAFRLTVSSVKSMCVFIFRFVFFRYRPSYNVSPGANLPVFRRGDGTEGEEAIVHCMKWGLVPSFTKKSEKPDHYKMV